MGFIIISSGALYHKSGVIYNAIPTNSLWRDRFMLQGTFQHNMDDKYRVFIPSKMRDQLGDRFIAAKGVEHCVSLYSLEEWKSFLKKFDDYPMAETRNMKIYFLGGSEEVKPDSQGRVVVKQMLRDHAGLNRELMIIGLDDHAEIWDKQRWDERFGNITCESVMETMVRLGFR